MPLSVVQLRCFIPGPASNGDLPPGHGQVQQAAVGAREEWRRGALYALAEPDSNDSHDFFFVHDNRDDDDSYSSDG